jgi:transposase
MPKGYPITLRPLDPDERQMIEQIARSQSTPAMIVGWARMLLAVDDGVSFTEAAQCGGRVNRHTVAGVVHRFNVEGLGALVPRAKGRPPVQYGVQEADRILTEFRRKPTLEQDGTATWSLALLQRALRAAPDGLPHVSTWTIFQVLHTAGYTWQESRTWCQTGTVKRKRGGKIVEVTDPETDQKRG